MGRQRRTVCGDKGGLYGEIKEKTVWGEKGLYGKKKKEDCLGR